MVDSLWHETYNEDDHDLIHGGEDFDGDNNEDKRLLWLCWKRCYDDDDDDDDDDDNVDDDDDDKHFIKVIEDVFRVYIVSSKHDGGWENSRQLCKPETAQLICI